MVVYCDLNQFSTIFKLVHSVKSSLTVAITIKLELRFSSVIPSFKSIFLFSTLICMLTKWSASVWKNTVYYDIDVFYDLVEYYVSFSHYIYLF